MKLKKYKLDQLYEIGSGIGTTTEQAGHGAPFVSFSTIFNNYFMPDVLCERMDTSLEEQERYSVKAGDVFLTRTSETIDELAMSCVALKDYPTATFSGFAKRLRPLQNDKTYPKYMGFFLRSPYFRKIINNNTVMTLRASFNEDIFSYIYVYLPDYKEQVKIGDFLYDIEQKAINDSKQIQKLEDYLSLLFDYWFTQYDFPNAEGKPYRESGGKMYFNKEIKRKIPVGWSVKTLDEIATMKITSVSPYDHPDLMYEHYSIPAYDLCKYPSIEKGSGIASDKYLVPKGSLLISKLNPQFKRLWIPVSHGECSICSTEFIPYVCKNEENIGFLYGILNSEAFQNYLLQSAISSTGSRKRVLPELCDGFKLPYPDNEALVRKFCNITNDVIERIRKCVIDRKKMIDLRDYLVPFLSVGQCNIK